MQECMQWDKTQALAILCGKLGEGKWKIGRREVENWPKGSGKSTHAVGQGETNMKYDLEGNPVEKC